MTMPLVLPPLSLYIHIPWCVKKCPYCDFNSHENLPDQNLQTAYIKALVDDLNTDSHYIQGRQLHSIFIGGGTPSLFAPQAIATLLREVEKIISFENDIEITLEANPGTLDNTHLYDYRLAGVNRLSLGIQSFNDEHLKKLGRIHNSDQVYRAIEHAHQADFKQINFDLMHGLPQQSHAQALNDLDTALSFAPTHLSWYQLTIEPNTAFYSAPPMLPNDDILSNISDRGMALLSDNGFSQYEVSAFHKKDQQDCRSQHNVNYWQFGDYLGIGAGAHGKITLSESSALIRTQKTRLPAHYLDASKQYTSKSAAIAPDDIAIEFFMNALRLNNGFSLALFEQRTGISRKAITERLHTLQAEGLLETSGDRYFASNHGQRYLNTLLLKISD